MKRDNIPVLLSHPFASSPLVRPSFFPLPPLRPPPLHLCSRAPRPRASRSRFARSALVVSQNRSFLATKPRSGTMLPVRSSTDDQRPGVSLSEEAPALRKQTKSAALRARTRFRGHFQADFAHAHADPPDVRNSLGPPDQPASPDPLDPPISSGPPTPPPRTARPAPRASSLAKNNGPRHCRGPQKRSQLLAQLRRSVTHPRTAP